MTKTVATAGTAEPLGPPVRANLFYVQAFSTNTDKVFIDYEPDTPIPVAVELEVPEVYNGPVAASEEGIPLAAGEYVTLPGPVLDRWWIDAAVSGEGVSITPL